MSTTLFRGGVIHGSAGASALAVENGRISWIGEDDQSSAYDAADRIIELHGALLGPAFTDSHVHSVLTGFMLTRLDLRFTPTLAEALDEVSALAAAQPDGVVIGTGWEEHSWPEGRPPTAEELERAAPGRMVLLERRDCHSSVISPALMAAIPGLAGHDGFNPNGRLELDARQAASDALAEFVGPEQRLVAATAAAQALASSGIAGFHECLAPHIGAPYEIELVRVAAQRVGIIPTIYWGERDAFDFAAAERVAGLAGDLNADGAIGSRTAALFRDYDDQHGNRGHAFLSAEEIAGHLVACTRAGLQGGYHCIGEAALEVIAEGLRLAEKQVGRSAMITARHRLEHIEMAAPALIEAMADLGVVASMQPAFDELWGGPELMYADRLGERWHGMNPVGSMARAGVRMAFGSDSPVTQIGPWQAIRAAINHHDEDERICAATAFEAHTRGGWFASRVDDAGRAAVGERAHLTVWDCPVGLEGDLPVLDPDAPLPNLRHLMVDGDFTGENS